MPTKSNASDSKKKSPEKKIGPYPGGIGVAIWLNTIDTDQGPREVRSITIAPRRYVDRQSGEWRDASSFRPVDLPALIYCLQRALEFCSTETLPNAAPGDSNEELQF